MRRSAPLPADHVRGTFPAGEARLLVLFTRSPNKCSQPCTSCPVWDSWCPLHPLATPQLSSLSATEQWPSVVVFSTPEGGVLAWRSAHGNFLWTFFERSEDASCPSVKGLSSTCLRARSLRAACSSGSVMAPTIAGEVPFCERACSSTSNDVVIGGYVWDAIIFSLVTLVGGAADLCVARGCRVSPHTCGHIRAARAEFASTELPSDEELDEDAADADIADTLTFAHGVGASDARGAADDATYLAQHLAHIDTNPRRHAGNEQDLPALPPPPGPAPVQLAPPGSDLG